MKQSMFINIYIIPFLILSPLFAMSCNSWFSIWINLELNSMTFIPFLIFFNKFNKEISMKYFIIQTFSSFIFLMSSNFLLINFYNKNLIIIIILMNLSLLMKLGSAPFHSWFINLMSNMSWINCMILSTWQKIIPMITLMYMFNYNLIYLIIILSNLISSILGINHQSIRIILAFSSINHISWLMLNMLISQFMWMSYFFSYLIINISIMMILKFFKIFYLNQLFYLNFNMFMNFFMINLFSLSSLPPLFGFLIKWISINSSIWFKLNILIIIMMMMSIFSFIMYIRLTISFLLNFNISNKILLSHKFTKLNNKISLFHMFFISSFLNLWILSIWLI